MDSYVYILNRLGQPNRYGSPYSNEIYDKVWKPESLTRLNVRLIPVKITHDYFGLIIGEGERNDELAQSYADAAMMLFSFFENYTDFEIPVAYPIPSCIIKDGEVKIEDIIEEDSHREYNERYRELAIYSIFSSCYLISAEVIEDMWKNIPILLDNPNIFNAVCFYSASIREIHFEGDSIDDAFMEVDKTPISKIGLTLAENAILNAFKAIEAIIGDPPKNEARLRSKIQDIGLDPDDKMFLYPEFGGSILDEIRRLSLARDKRAAHGRTNKERKITYFEMMNAQFLARLIILASLGKYSSISGAQDQGKL